MISFTVVVITALALAGCQTPDLKPFATTSSAVTASINQGGDQIIELIAQQPAYTPEGNIVRPDSPEHPVFRLEAEWKKRRAAADAICTYSGSLASIGQASANRRANAAALYDSVKDLAASIPGLGTGVSAAGNLMISTLDGFVEVKAWHDMGKAVKSADSAVQAIAGYLQKDMESLALLHESVYQNKVTLAEGDKRYGALRLLEKALREKQDQQRDVVKNNPGDPTAGNELARINSLLADVQRDLTGRRAEIASIENSIRSGRQFYAAAAKAIGTWAAAHADLVKAFEQKRPPNLALLATRAEELNALLQDFKNTRKITSSP